MEKIRVKINIAGSEFTILSQDDEAYTNAVAADVNKKINEIRKANPQASVTAAAMLAALNFCDGTKKAEQSADNFRIQIKEYLNEISQIKAEADELKKENQRLKKDIQTYRQRLSNDVTTKDSNSAPVSPAVKAVKKAISVSDSEEAAEEYAEFFDIKSE